MMALVFREEAKFDLEQIISWYEDRDPLDADRVLADINRAIDLVRQHPRIGRPIGDGLVRRLLTSRYRFKIAYSLDAGHVVVIGIFRFQNREV